MKETAGWPFELSLDLLCTATDDLYFDQLSESWERTLGWSRGELRAEPFLNFCHPDDVEPTRVKASEMLRDGADAVHFENRYRHRAGHYIWLSWMATTNDGVLYGIARDVSAYKKQEMALRTAIAELQEFSYAVSHDLQEPLRAITGHIELARVEGAIPPEFTAYFEQIEVGASRMQTMLGGLLDYSRLETRAGASERVSLSRIAEHVLADHPALDASIGPLPVILGERSQIERLVQNIVSNAVRYRHPGRAPRMEISAQSRAGRVVLAFRDNGMGIHPGQEARALQLFARCHPRSQSPEGEGIGLALCKRIAERHGGTVRLVNNDDRVGLTVVVELDAA